MALAATSSQAKPVERVRSGPADRLHQQIDWYDGKATAAKRSYTRLKVAQIVIAAAIPVSAAGGAPSIVAAVLGGTIVVIEGLQQLFKFHDAWVGYRSTCEALQREMYLFDAAAGPYRGCTDPSPLLAERIEAIMAREHDTWTASRLEPEKDGSGAG